MKLPLIILVLGVLGALAFFGFKNFGTGSPNTSSSENTSPNDSKSFLKPQLTYEGAYNGPLYDSSSKIGDSAPLDLHFENMDRNGVNYLIGYFFAEEVTSTDYVKGEIKKHPGRIIPFYSSGLGGEEAEKFVGEELTKMFEMALPMAKKHLGENVISGIGEIEMFQWSIPHNDPKVLQLFDFASQNNLKVMIHPLPGKIPQVEAILEKFPDTLFLIHMFKEDFAKERKNIIELMSTHKNIYFTIDIDHLLFDKEAGTGLLYKFEDMDVTSGRDAFIKDFDGKYEAMLKSDLEVYKPLIDAHSDKVTWGTEMNLRYTYEAEVYDRMIKFIRLFIGSLDPSVQEKVGYKNALTGFGEGVTLP